MLVLTAGTYGNVLRFLPPLVIGEDLLRDALGVLEKAFASLAPRASAPPGPRGSRTCRAGRGTASAGTASGPSTPTPLHAPEASSSSATTGLIAVCQTTAWEPYSAIDQALSTTW